LPGFVGDVEATAKKLEAAIAWLDGRLANAAARDAEVTMGTLAPPSGVPPP